MEPKTGIERDQINERGFLRCRESVGLSNGIRHGRRTKMSDCRNCAEFYGIILGMNFDIVNSGAGFDKSARALRPCIGLIIGSGYVVTSEFGYHRMKCD